MASSKKKKRSDLSITESSGNVFADLGVPNPEEMMAKAEIAGRIFCIIEDRGLTQTAAAKILKISQPKVSLLLRGRLDDFSMERLIRFLNDLDQDVYISIVPATSPGRAKTRIGDSSSNARIAALGK